MKIIVTGGAGYIGSHTVVELINSGFNPVIVDNLCNTDTRNLDGIKEITGLEVKWYNVDCSNKEELDLVFQQEKDVIGVVHFAAYKSVGESIIDPEKYYDNNIGSLNVLLDTMIKYKLDNIVFSSSCTVYGTPDRLPVTELSPFKKPESPYGETKQICEDILKGIDINSVSLRYFNPIGSHNSSLIGDCSTDRSANLIPIICEVASGTRQELVINGNNYSTFDGTCVRDYIHVVDLAKSHVSALNYLLQYSNKEVFNVGTGKGLSVLEAVHTFEQVNKKKINYSIGSRREGDIEAIYSDNKKIKDILDWEAKISVEKAMRDAWKWELKKQK